jgi:hypothetical protein
MLKYKLHLAPILEKSDKPQNIILTGEARYGYILYATNA